MCFLGVTEEALGSGCLVSFIHTSLEFKFLSENIDPLCCCSKYVIILYIYIYPSLLLEDWAEWWSSKNLNAFFAKWTAINWEFKRRLQYFLDKRCFKNFNHFPFTILDEPRAPVIQNMKKSTNPSWWFQTHLKNMLVKMGSSSPKKGWT